MSSTKNDFEPDAEASMMAFLEEKERLAQLRDEAYIRAFWKFKSPESIF
jgi:hypothetical protein